MQKLTEFADRMAQLKKEMETEGKAALLEVFQGFFAEFPEVKAIQWAQYTPYFNDGDTCTFSVRELCLRFDEESELIAEDLRDVLRKDDERDDDFYESDLWHLSSYGALKDRSNTAREQQVTKSFDALEKCCRSIKDTFLLAFGDHVRVRATRDGIDVTEHDHD